MNRHLYRWIGLLTISCWASSTAANIEINGQLSVAMVFQQQSQSFVDKGSSIGRYSSTTAQIQQAFMQASSHWGNGWHARVNANYYPDGEQHLGITEAEIGYKPLSPDKIKWRMRGGFFYPGMSLENVGKGWLSPYTYTQSALNSWIGEELRTPGIEFTLYSPGRRRGSPWSWQAHIAAFKGNDPLGTLISWRGFALHDRQSLHHDRVEFAPYPPVIDRDLIWHPSWVEPFREIDKRTGFYAGLHLDYLQQSSLRYYYYDNNADPLAVNEQRLYAWHTRFHSLAIQHKFDNDLRLIAQLMVGDTLMGYHFVYADFVAAYILLSYQSGQHLFSARFDHFEVNEDDIFPQDPNNSDGHGVTLAWRYDLTRQWQIGTEMHANQSYAANRLTLNEPSEQDQSRVSFHLQYQF